MKTIACLPLSLVLFAGCQAAGGATDIEVPAAKSCACAMAESGPCCSTEAAPPFAQELLAAAREFLTWQRVSDGANVAPTMCRIPPRAGVQRSASIDSDSHGKKLYFLFAKDAPAYTALTMFESHTEAERDAMVQRLIGEVIVKQSFQAVEVPVASVPKLVAHNLGDREIPVDYVVAGGKAYHTGEPGDLFVMLKVDPETAGTDQGWVYGTVDAEGTGVSSSGLVASCMACHKDAPRDRLFGFFPPKTKAADVAGSPQ